MAFGTNAAILEDQGQTSLGNSSSEVAIGAFSVAADTNSFTNTVRAPSAAFVLEANFSATPDANSVILLYAQLLDIVGTTDADIPDANYRNVYVGSFLVNDVTTAQVIPISGGYVPIPSIKQAQIIQFIIENQTGVAIPAAWDLNITPITLTAAA